METGGSLPFGEQDVRGAFAQTSAARGESYARQGRVTKLAVTNSGSTLAAEVRGSRSTPYVVTAYATRRRGARTRMTGYCECPIGVDCKHVAATFFAALAQSERPEREARAAQTTSDARIDAWLRDVGASTASASRRDDSAAGDHVAYVFGADAASRIADFDLHIVAVRRAANGDRTQSLGSDALAYTTEAFVEPADTVIGRLLHVYATTQRGRAALAEDIVRRIVATGNAFFEDRESRPLTLGERRPAQLSWEVNVDGSQRPALAFEDTRVVKFPGPLGWYVDRAEGLIGPIDAGICATTLQTLLAAPALAAERVTSVYASLVQAIPGLPLPPPHAVVERAESVALVPTLRLRSAEDPSLFAGRAIDVAEFSFAYGSAVVDPRSNARSARSLTGTESLVYARDSFAEAIASKRLEIAGLTEDAALRASLRAVGRALRYDDSLAWQWAPFVHEIVPVLRADGWQIEIDPSFGRRIVDLAPEEAWHATVVDSGNGWFDLALGIDIDGKRYDLLPMLAELLQSGADVAESESVKSTYYVSLGDDTTTLALPYARVRAIVDTLVELGEPSALGGEGRLRLPLAQAALLNEIETASGLRFELPARVRALGERLRASQGLDRVAVPESFNGTLRPYQRDGLDWLQILAAHELGGVLADDMGLGKSVQTLAHLLCEKEAGRLTEPALLVVPTSLVYNWCDEAARFTPSLRVLALHGPGRERQFGRIAEHDLVITTYALLVRDRILSQRRWQIAIIDEAQALKNPLSKLARAATDVRAAQRICLTGTPVENTLGDLWSLFSVALPGLLGDRTRFNKIFRVPIEKRNDAGRRRALAQRVAPFLLRRTKEAVAPELPEKTEILQRVELTGAQRDLYETVRLAVSERVQDEIAHNGLARSQIVILDALLKLRQVCCDPRLLPERLRTDAGSVKLEMLLEMLPQAIAEGRRVLLFSQFTSMLEIVATALDARGIAYVTLTGETKDRQGAVERFQAREVPLFLISLKAGGTGLNLTAADTVIHYDPWWNPAVERQATDRAHRIGQTQPIFVYKFVCAGTVEEKIIDLQRRKAELARAIFSEEGTAARFGSDDIEQLFAPIDRRATTRA